MPKIVVTRAGRVAVAAWMLFAASIVAVTAPPLLLILAPATWALRRRRRPRRTFLTPQERAYHAAVLRGLR